MNKDLLLVVKQNSPICTMDLAKKLDTSDVKKKPDLYYAGVVSDLKELEEAGEVACIGKKFIDKYGKLFDVYTSAVGVKDEAAAAYNQNAKNAQILSLAKTLYEEFKEHQTVQPLEDAIELIKLGKGKISLKYHLLEREDLIAVYKQVINGAPRWFSAEQNHAKDNSNYTNNGKLKPYKIPYQIA